MRSIVIPLLVVLALAGCATKEGIVLPSSRPSQSDIGDFNKRNAQGPSAAVPSTPRRDVVKTSMVPEVQGAKLIVVGNTMALTVFDDATLNQRYENYLQQLSGKPPAFTREWYVATSSGQTSVKFSGVTGIYTRFYRAEVPKDLIRQTSFASAFGTFMAGTSADLVVAQVLPGYGSWITHVLCSERDPNYADCESQYRRGLYQSADGKEVDTTLKLVEGGATIDTGSFRVITGASQQVPAAAAAAAAVPVPPAAQPSSAPSPGTTPPKDEALQLQKLKELFDKGLISKEEYERKRKEVLDRLYRRAWRWTGAVGGGSVTVPSYVDGP